MGSHLPLRRAGLPGGVSRRGRPSDGRQEFWLCVPVSHARHHHHQGDGGGGEDLRNAGATRLQLRPQAHVHHLYEHTRTP